MIENNLLKTNFLGKDGFRWWIGQVAPEKAQGNQINQVGKAWGARVKVRIYGYHPADETELPNEDLPWAQVLLNAQGGSGKGGRSKSMRISPGDTVLGFFLDGDDAQLPVILGLFAATGARFGGGGKYKNPFEPFTGYTSKVKPGKIINKNEDGGQSGKKNQKSPRVLPEDLIKTLNEKAEAAANEAPSLLSGLGGLIPPAAAGTLTENLNSVDFASGIEAASAGLTEGLSNFDTSALEASVSPVIGQMVSFAGSSETEQIKNDLRNTIASFKGATPQQKFKLKSDLTKKVSTVSKGLVSQMTNKSFKRMAPIINGNLGDIYSNVFTATLAATKNTSIAKKAGTAAQAAMIPAIKNLQEQLPCVTQAVSDSLFGSISDLLTPMLDNVEEFTECIGDQMTGAIFNKILGGLGSGLGPALSGASKVLGGFNPLDDIRSQAEGLLGISEALKCITPQKVAAESNFWQIGKGASNVVGVAAETIMEVANIAQEIQEASGAPLGVLGSIAADIGAFDFLNPNVSTQGFSSALGECYTGPPLNCKGVKINVFGADGSGVDARPIIGALVPDAFVEQTGSLIGVQLANPGNGYTVPPLVEVTDTCNRGYGAVAKAVIDYDPQSPTYQQVTDIYIVSPGENYPVIEENIDETFTVDHVVVVNPGSGYKEEDVITDNEGNEYTKFLDDQGRILNVIPPNPQTQNVIAVSGIPVLEIESDTGVGALIKPQIAPRPAYQGEIKQNIDCITPRDGIVGFVNGEPYYGPFHVHPTRGVKMVGVAHTTSAHAIIYDTPAESRGRNASITTGSTQIQTVASQGSTTYTPPATPSSTTETTPMIDTTGGDGNVTYQDTTPTPPSTPSSSDDSGSSSTPPPSSPPPSSGGGGYGY